ncbi:hypothetical protein PGSY75_1020500 [Plasmodium gaboni]|uniref:Ribosomal silencing factor RsfS n=1 Tax=Plasmodium gaboni TaxID=647221 RepID=A0A151LKT1_9APIC|nr:hypothetical protein PGSY75_1020500 [Plasmodium gaboni]KYN99585.1 hypothetical protein PGSY75_1020500 [Plasmodium gaboni]
MLKKFSPFSFLGSQKRYTTSEHKIFDKIKNSIKSPKNSRHSYNEKDKIELINIDNEIINKGNISFKCELINEDITKNSNKKDNIDEMINANIYDNHFNINNKYNNVMSNDNIDIKCFIRETIDYYKSLQLKKKQDHLNVFNEKKTEYSNMKEDHNKNEIINKKIQDNNFILDNKNVQNGVYNDIHYNNYNSNKYKDNSNSQNSTYGQTYESYNFLTPAQVFFENNKEKLIQESYKYYKERENNINKDDYVYDENEDYYNYANMKNPVIRPNDKEGFLFNYEDDDNNNNNNNNDDDEDMTLEKGIMPTIEQIICILKHEKVKDIKVIDLDKCGRRDIGMFLILCTGNTAKHNKKVGKLISKIFIDLEIPYISNVVYCYCNKFDEWIITHCGPLKIHILTEELRNLYDIENLFLYPHEHFDNTNFPSFFDYTPGIPPPYLVRSNASMDSYKNDDIYNKFLTQK